MASTQRKNPFVSKLNENQNLPIFGVHIKKNNNEYENNNNMSKKKKKKSNIRNPTRPKSSSSIKNNRRTKNITFKTFSRSNNNNNSKHYNRNVAEEKASGMYGRFLLTKKKRPASAKNPHELAKVSTAIQNQIQRPIERLFTNNAAINLVDQRKQQQSAVGVGNERWVSYATKHVIDEYKKMDEDKAAEIWLANKAITDIKPIEKDMVQKIKSQPESYDLQFLKKIGLDRKSLRKAGLSNETIERVYRALFVYSFGFHEMLDEVSNNCANNIQGGSGKIVLKIWEVFNALLEKCEGDGYKTMIASLQHDYVEQREVIVKSYERRLHDAGLIRDKILSDLQIRTNERDDTHKTLVNKIDEIKNLNGKIMYHLGSIDHLKNELDVAQEEMLNARKRERIAVNNLRDSENIIVKLKLDIKEEEMKRADISAQLRDFKSIKNDAVRKEQRAMAMMNKLEMEIGTIKSMKNEMKKELDREIRNRSTESQRAEALERQVLLLQTHLQRTNKDITVLEETVDRKNLQMKVQNNKIERLNESIENVNKAKQNVEESLATEIEKVNTALKVNATLNEEKNDITTKLNQSIIGENNLRKSLVESDVMKANLKQEADTIKSKFDDAIMELRDTNSEYSKAKYTNMKLDDKLNAATTKIQKLEDIVSNKKKEIENLNVQIENFKNAIIKKDNSYEELQEICYKQMREMSEKMVANMEKVKQATELNVKTIPKMKEMKNELIKLQIMNKNLKMESNRVSKLYEAEQFKSMSFMKLISLQEELTSVVNTSITQQKQDIEYIQNICNNTPWNTILESPVKGNEKAYLSNISAIWVSSLVSNALSKIVKQYNFDYGIVGEEKDDDHNINNDNDDDDDDTESMENNVEILNALANIKSMKQNIVKKSTKQFRIHEINKEMTNAIKAKLSKIQEIFYHRLHRDKNIRGKELSIRD